MCLLKFGHIFFLVVACVRSCSLSSFLLISKDDKLKLSTHTETCFDIACQCGCRCVWTLLWIWTTVTKFHPYVECKFRRMPIFFLSLSFYSTVDNEEGEKSRQKYENIQSKSDSCLKRIVDCILYKLRKEFTFNKHDCVWWRSKRFTENQMNANFDVCESSWIEWNICLLFSYIHLLELGICAMVILNWPMEWSKFSHRIISSGFGYYHFILFFWYFLPRTFKMVTSACSQSILLLNTFGPFYYWHKVKVGSS